jgi:hypothetical protein
MLFLKNYTNFKGMKYTIILVLFCIIAACSQPADTTQKLQAKIDNLQHKLDKAYHPGFGDFMAGIQVHHAKLWFAGQAQNWKLADFEINEIKEALDGIKEYCTGHPETKSITMLDPVIDTMTNAINSKNPGRFKNGFTLLTATCNNCHRATSHEFNVIKIPDNAPFSNQEFRPQ